MSRSREPTDVHDRCFPRILQDNLKHGFLGGCGFIFIIGPKPQKDFLHTNSIRREGVERTVDWMIRQYFKNADMYLNTTGRKAQ